MPIEWADGRIVFQGTPGPQHYNPLGTIHGGYAVTLLDSCVGCAVHSMLPAGKGYTTLELKVNNSTRSQRRRVSVSSHEERADIGCPRSP